MKNIFRTVVILVVVMAISATNSIGQPPKMKMTTPMPEGIATPDELETSIGTLTSFDGVPDKETNRMSTIILTCNVPPMPSSRPFRFPR